MVDEWLSGEGDAGIFAASKDIRFWNLRVGKCGGLTGTVIMGRLGYRAGVKLVLGALVGEDALMVRAGDVVARILPLAWREDSFSRLLLQKSVFASNRVRKRAIIRDADGFGLDAAEIKAEHSFAVHRFHAGTVSKSTPDDFAF
jgi:hypothetical protein